MSVHRRCQLLVERRFTWVGRYAGKPSNANPSMLQYIITASVVTSKRQPYKSHPWRYSFQGFSLRFHAFENNSRDSRGMRIGSPTCRRALGATHRCKHIVSDTPLHQSGFAPRNKLEQSWRRSTWILPMDFVLKATCFVTSMIFFS